MKPTVSGASLASLGIGEQPAQRRTKDTMTQTTTTSDVDTFPPDRPKPELRVLPPSKGYPFKTFDEMFGETAAKNWLIKGVLAKGETSAWIAPPGGMKSALLAQASICVGSGLDWQGKRNKGAAGVVYFALERADLVEKRIKAHCLRLGLKSLPIAVVAVTFDLIKPKSVKRVITTIQEAETVFGVGVGLVIFDTFAKLIAAGGGDENQAKDQGAVFANVQRIKNAIGAHVAIIGHTGKDVQKGARGSNAILGDVDIMIEISGDIVRTATITKANDMPEGPCSHSSRICTSSAPTRTTTRSPSTWSATTRFQFKPRRRTAAKSYPPTQRRHSGCCMTPERLD